MKNRWKYKSKREFFISYLHDVKILLQLTQLQHMSTLIWYADLAAQSLL